MRDGEARRHKILQAATLLFIQNGFDGMTYVALSARSSSAIGSILHFFKSKEQIAAAVYDRVAGSLIVDCETALNGHGRKAQDDIQAVIQACQDWHEKYPKHWRLLGMLEANMSMATLAQYGCWKDHLEKALEVWADPQIRAGRIRPFPAALLYACVLAPAMSLTNRSKIDDSGKNVDWVEVFTRIAVQTVLPLNKNLKPALPQTSEKGRPQITPASEASDSAQGKFTL